MKRFHKEIGTDVRIGVRILHLITNKYTCVNKYIIDCNNYNNHIINYLICNSTSYYEDIMSSPVKTKSMNKFLFLTNH